MSSVAKKKALVCGASAGIGQAVARALAKQDVHVILLARRGEMLRTLCDELNHLKPDSASILIADLDNRDDLIEKVNVALQSGPIHILINNTGGPPAGPILTAKEIDFSMAFGRHVLASHRLVQTVLPGMQASQFGRIINIISTSVREPIPNLGVSNTIRGAMASWAKSLARELPPNITINNVLPGFTDTQRLHSLKTAIAQKNKISLEDVHTNWLSQVPEGRLASPNETAAAVVFLASQSAGYIRGVSLPVDGGRMRSI